MITKEDLKQLEIIFTLARQAVVGDENNLIGVINFKKELFDKINKEFEEPKPELTKKDEYPSNS